MSNKRKTPEKDADMDRQPGNKMRKTTTTATTATKGFNSVPDFVTAEGKSLTFLSSPARQDLRPPIHRRGCDEP